MDELGDDFSSFFEWFNALPMYHFLTGKSKPFQETKVEWPLRHPEPEFDTDAVGIYQIRFQANKETRYIYFSAELCYIVRMCLMWLLN